MASVYLGLAIMLIIVIVLFVMSGIKIIQPYEQGLEIRLGTFRRRLNPGLNMVIPMVTDVIRLDLRTQTLDVPRQEVITKDNSPTNVDAVIYIKIIDPNKAYFEVQNYKMATIYLAQTTLRSVIGDMELDEILSSRERINHHLRDTLDAATDPWGVKVEAVEIREVDPAGPVKAAMEEQTSAERERRAAVLRADGKKKAAILTAEGEKRSKILVAEGLRQSNIVQAEGERLARILKAQGEAQKLRILSLGASSLDQKSLTVLSLNTLQSIGNGKATKIIFPFEVSRLLEGAADYIGAGRKVPDRPLTDIDDLESKIGSADEVLGKIPSPEQLKEELDSYEKEFRKESRLVTEMAASRRSSAAGEKLELKASTKKTKRVPRTNKPRANKEWP